MVNRLLKTVLPFAAAIFSLSVAACNDIDVVVGRDGGVPLAELDMSGTPPTKLVLAGPDKVVVTEGAQLDIKVSGDQAAIDELRFNIEDGTLGIMREKSTNARGVATIAVTMPAPKEIVLAGSGDISAPALVDDGEVNIAGSGNVAIARLQSTKLGVNLMGSGTISAAGTAERLDLNIAGSGAMNARQLDVQQAEINIAGSGNGEFASNGKVEARIAGSGNVTVYGRADCSIKAIGSGSVRCRPADGAGSATPAPAAPAAPAVPPAPGAPSAPAAPQPDA